MSIIRVLIWVIYLGILGISLFVDLAVSNKKEVSGSTFVNGVLGFVVVLIVHLMLTDHINYPYLYDVTIKDDQGVERVYRELKKEPEVSGSQIFLEMPNGSTKIIVGKIIRIDSETRKFITDRYNEDNDA